MIFHSNDTYLYGDNTSLIITADTLKELEAKVIEVIELFKDLCCRN